MIDDITRTIYGSYLQTCQTLGRPFVAPPFSTLNQKFGVQQNTGLGSNEVPTVKYFAIGNGGHAMTVGANGLTKPQVIKHRATDAALFNHLPFVLREITNDLSSGDRAKYAMRKQETHGGHQYIAYYLKRIDYTGVQPGMNSIAVVNGVSAVTPFVPNSANMNPSVPDLSPSGINLVDGNYAAASALVTLQLDANEVTELRNVATILYNDEDFAIISEVGLVSGVDKVVTSPAASGATINFNEAIAAQIVSHISSFFAVKFTNNNNAMLLDVGSTEPLLSIS